MSASAYNAAPMADESVQQLRTDALAALTKAGDEAALQAWHIEFLGRRGGKLTGILRTLGSLSVDDRKTVGAAANALKPELEAAFEAREQALRRSALAQSIETGRIDVTLPARPHRRGGLHPVTQLLRKMLDALTSMGFSVVEGPEVELDFYNFEGLRIPQDHPARDMWDTMWVDEEVDGRR